MTDKSKNTPVDNSAWETELDDNVHEELEPTEDKLSLFRERHKDILEGKDFHELKEHTKVYLALLDSDDEEWGIVEDCNTDILWVPGKGTIVGTWTRSKVDGLIHLSLMTSLHALEDRSVASFLQLSLDKKAKKEAKASGKRSSRKKKDKAEEPEHVDVKKKMEFDSMRALLKSRNK